MSDFLNKYPYTDFHELNLDWVIERVKKLTDDWLATHEEWVGVQQDWADTEQAWIDFKAYVENYLANLDVQDEIDHKIDQMVADGSLRNLIKPDVDAQTIATATNWLETNITQPTTPVIDESLTIRTAGADSLITGTRMKALSDTSGGAVASVPTQSGYWDTSDGQYRNYVTPLHCSLKFYVQPRSKLTINDNVTTNVTILLYDKSEAYIGYIMIYPGCVIYLPDDAEIGAFNYYDSESLSAISFNLENEISINSSLTNETVSFNNFYNGHYISGIQKQQNGDKYGDVNANANYIVTDPIPLKYFNTIYALSNFAGSETLYITYFDKDFLAVDNANSRIIINSTFNASAKYFCICVHINALNTLMIYNKFTDRFITSESLSGDNIPAKNFKRLEHGQLVGVPGQTVGQAVYPVNTSNTSIYCSYPFSVENISKLSYINLNGQKLLIFVNSSGNVISTETCNGFSKGTVDVPAGAVFALYYTGLSGDPETQFSIVAGTTIPDGIYPYDVYDLENLDSSTDYLKGKSIVFDGDSITEGAGVTDISWGIGPNNNKGWGYWIQQNHPASICYGFGQSGWTVGRRTGYTDSLLNHISSYPATVDLFVLSGGYNDQAVQMAMGDLVAVTDGADAYFNATFDEDTFIGALESWFQQLRAGYPFAKIVYILTPQRIYSSDPVFNRDTKGQQVRGVLYSSGKERMDLFWEKIRTVCDKWSIKYLDLSKECGVVGTGETTDPGLTIGTRYYQTSGGVPDFTHPNTNFYREMIIPLIENLIQTVMPK